MNAMPKFAPETAFLKSALERVSRYDWSKLSTDLSDYGCAVIDKLLSPEECGQIAGLYSQETHFRSHVHMARHGFGKGEYRYFKYPLPELLSGLRTAFYPRLAGVANDWNERMGIDQRYPARHADFLGACHRQGQVRPTPLLLQYVAGDFNCLHQDLYGDQVFPLQATILLSRPGADFTGGEFVVSEQRPRMQARHLRAQLVPVAGSRQRDMTKMELEIEAGVVDPIGAGHRERQLDHAPAEHRGPVGPLRKMALDVVEPHVARGRRPPIVDRQRRSVHGRRAGIEMEVQALQSGQLFHAYSVAKHDGVAHA